LENSEKIIGTPVDAERKEDLLNLKKSLDYEKGISKIDNQAKWIFTASSIVGTLAAGISNYSYSKLTPIGDILYTVSLLFLTVALVLASHTLIPVKLSFNPNSIESMKQEIENKLLKKRGQKIIIASYLFSCSILLAGLSPVVSKYDIPKNETRVNHFFKLEVFKNLNCGVEAIHLRPNSLIQYKINAFKEESVDCLYKEVENANEVGEFKDSVHLDLAQMKIFPDSIIASFSYYNKDSFLRDTSFSLFNNR
jgi:hypothetical protein